MTIQAPPLPPNKPTNYNQSSPTLPPSNTPSTTPQTPTATNNTPPPPPRPKLANLFSRLTNDNNFTFHHLHLTRDDLQLSEHLKKLNFSSIQHILQFYDFSVHRFVVLPVTCHLPIDQLIGHPMYKHHSLSHLSGAIEPFQNGGQLLDHYLVYPNKQIPDQLLSNAKKNEQGLFTIESIYQAESSREKGQFEYLFEKSNDDNTCHLMSTKHIQQRFINLVNIDCPFDYQMRLSKEQGIVNRLNIYGRALKATLDAIHSRKPTSKPSTPTTGTLGRSGSLGGSLGVFVQSKSSSNLKDVTRMDSPRTPTQTSTPTPLLPTGGPKDAEYYDEYYAMTQKLRDADFLSDLDINSFEEVEQFFNILKKQIFATALVKSMYGAKKRVANSVVSTQSTSKNDKKSTNESEREVGLLFSSLSFSTMSHTLEQHLVNDLLKHIPELTSISRGTTGSVSEQLARESFFKNVQYFNGCSIDHKLLPISLREGSFSGDLKWKKVDYFDNFSNETCKLLAEKCKGLTNLNVSGTVFLDTKVVKDVNISQIAPSKIFNESGLMTLADHCKLLSSIEIRMGKWDIKGTNYLLQALPRLTKLSVPGVNMDESTFKAISENRTLKHLLINNCEACNDQNLKFLYNHPTISQLVIQNCTGVQNGILGLVEANSPSLVYLELVNLHNLTDGYLDVSKNTNIKTLKVNHCRTLTTQNIVSLSKTQSAITNLMIRGTTDTIVLSSIGQGYLANQLQVLDLSKTSFPYTQILKSEGPVTAFQPVYYPVTPVATEDYKLIIQACRHLRVLILDCNHNVNDNIIYLLSDQTHPHLERLSLEKTSVTQKGINHIYAHFSSQSSNLSALNLRTRTSGELNMIDNLPNIPKLKEVHLGLIRSHSIAMHYVKKLSMCKALDTVYVEFDSLEAKHKLVENNKLKDIHFEI